MTNLSDPFTPASLPTDMELVMRVMPMPKDANGNGDIFGGWIMAQVDLAGCVLPLRIAKGRVATIAVNEFVFKNAVSIGDLLSFYARVERIGNTSITVHVAVYAERDPASPQIVKVTEANVTYVAIDLEGRPRAIPKPTTPAAQPTTAAA
jgi:acyl-CoA thioesterase YciA